MRATAERPGEAVTIAVDSGFGVPSELRPHLFDGPSPGTASHGIGLGFAIVRGLARAIDGDTEYVHLEATGPAFEVRLPVP